MLSHPHKEEGTRMLEKTCNYVLNVNVCVLSNGGQPFSRLFGASCVRCMVITLIQIQRLEEIWEIRCKGPVAQHAPSEGQ